MRLGALAAVAALGLGAADAALAQAQDETLDVTMILYAGEGVPFFEPMELAAKTAAERNNINLDIQYARVDQVRQNNLIETALANQVDGLLVEIWDDTAFDEILCKAMEEGTPVIGFNIDDSEGAAGTCRLAFIGQDFVETGISIGRRMIADHGFGEGDELYCPVEFPETTYAVKRHEGVQIALAEVGASCEMVGVSDSLPDVLTSMTQYLIGNPDIAGIITLGQHPLMMSQQALDEVGMDIPVGGFDVAAEVLEGIENGRITATVDQQPYQQGYYAVQQMAHFLRYGILPADMNTGGSGLVDKTNYTSAVEWAGIAR